MRAATRGLVLALGGFAAGALLAANVGSPAAADTAVETASVPLTTTSSTQVLTLDQLAVPGELHQVTVTVAVEGATNVEIGNLTDAAKATTVTVDGTVSADGPGVIGLAAETTASDTQDLAAGATGTFAVDGSGEQTTVITDPAQLAAYVGAGTVTFDVTGLVGVDVEGLAVWDASGAVEGTATVSLEYEFTPDLPPTAVDDAATVTEDDPATAIDVLANDTDVDGGTMLVTAVTQPTNGTVAITGGGSGLTYGPDPDYCNDPPGTTPDTFTYTLNGGSTATVSVTVTCVNDPPTAVDDTATVTEDASAAAVDVLANDTDVDGGTMLVTAVTQPTNGTVAITGGGSGLTYGPDPDYCNDPPGTTPDTFTYTLNGGSTATVSVTVTCVNDPPTAVDDTATVTEDASAAAVDVLANDTDVDGGTMLVTAVSQPANGTVVITGGGTGLTYGPDPDYCNDPPGTTPDTFTYTLNGGSTATVSVTVTCVNDPPTAVDDTTTVTEDAPATAIDVLANDTDVDGGSMLVTAVTQPTNGTVVITGGGTGLTYGPDPDFCNDPPGTTPDTFTYTLNGGSTATVSVTVTCVNDAPVVTPATVSLAENSANGTAVHTVAFTDGDAGQSHSFAITGGNTGGDFAIDPSTGAITVAASGALDFETTPSFALTVEVTDDGTPPLSGTATITVNIDDVNEAPVVTPATVPLDENSANGTAVHTVAFTDVDAGQSHTFAITAGNTGGAFAIDPATGAITVADSADLDFETTTTFALTVQVTDDGTPPLAGTATITVNLTDVNEASVVTPATVSLDENSPNGTAVHTVAFTDVDAGQTHSFAITSGNTGGAFAINPSTGAITVANSTALDFDTTPTFALTVEVTDDGTPPLSGTATVTVNLDDLNEAPSIFSPATASVERDITTAVVGISVADPDAGDIELTLSADNGTIDVDETASAAVVTGDGTDTVVITGTVAEINTILAATDGVTYLNDVGFAGATDSLHLDVDDLGTPALTASATITLQFNQPPVAADRTPTTNEDTPVIITLSATDADDDDLTFAIVSGPADGTLSAIGAVDCTTTVNTCTATVTYTPDADFNGADGFTYRADDGTNTDDGTVDITVTPVNDAPVAVADAFSTNEDTPLSVPAPGVLANDSDVDVATTLTAVLVTGPAHAASFTLNANGSFAYTPAADFNGPDSFTYRANDGTADSNTVTVTLTVNAVNDAPIVDTSAGSAAFTEGASPVQIDPAVSVTDVDGGNLASARVQLTGACQPGQDVLALTSPPAGITVAAYVSATCTLDLTGPAPVVTFQTALRAVTYTNTSDAPSTADRTATFTVTDPGALTGSDTRNITVTAVNDAPVITLSGSTPTYTEDGAAVTVDGGLTVTDPDDINLESGSVTITAGSQTGDSLTFTAGGTGITDTNAAPDLLTLTGTATIADWQTVLRSVQFSTTNQNPTTSRTVRFVVNDGTATSNIADKTVTVVPVNDAPVLTQPLATTLDYTEGAAPTVIAPTITATDVDSANLVGATIDIGTGYVNGQDVLSLGTNPQNGITAAAFDASNGTLTLTGSSSVANYQAALRDVRFTNTSQDPTGGLRNVTFQVNDGAAANNLSNIVSRNINVVPVNDAPDAVNDSFSGANAALANTRLAVGTTTTGPHLATPGSVLTNDTDVDSPPAGFTAGPATISSASCAGCNNVTLEADGNFLYDPPADFLGTDTFTYTLNDNDPDTPANQTDTATVSIEVVGPVVWYVDIDAAAPPAGQGGRSHSPFNSLAPLTTGGTADGLDGDGDIIFLGVDSAAPISPYEGGLVLETNQRLWGEPFGLTVDPTGVIGPTQLVAPSGNPDPTTNPNVRNSAAGGVGITLANGVDIQRVNAGITGAGSTAAGIAGTSVTTATIGPNQLVQGNGTGVTLSTAAAGDISVGATISGNTGTAVNVANRSGGTVTFSGNITGTTTNSAITLASNSGATVNLTGAINLANGGAAVTAFSATGGGTVTANNATNQVTSFAGTGVNLNAVTIGAGGVLFNTVTSAAGGAVNGITLTNVGGTGSFIVNSGAITATTRGLDVDGGSNNVTLGGPFTTSGASARSVEVTNRSGGTVDLNGLVTESSTGINLSANSTGLVRFDGGVTASTGVNTAFNATVSGNVAVTDVNGTTAPNNTLTTTTGTALNVQNTTIHADDLTFLSVSSNGGTNGIVLNNTGSGGGLTVTGNGGACTPGTPTCTGGTIQNTTGSDNSGATPPGTGIVLNNTQQVSLTNMRIRQNTNYGIRGDDVTGFSFASGLIDGVNGTNVATPFNDGSINLDRVVGTIAITGSDISGGFQRNIKIDHPATDASATATITITGNTIHDTSAAFGDDGIGIEAENSDNYTINVSNNSFARHGGDHVNVSMINSAIVDITISNNTLAGGHPVGLGQGILVFGASWNGTGTYDVLNNTINGNKQGGSIHMNKGSGTATMSGTVSGNVIGTTGVVGSGSEQAFGIVIGSRGAGGSHTALVTNNTIRQYFDRGIVVQAGEGAADLNITVTNNTVTEFADAVNSLHGIHFDIGILGTDTNDACIAVSGNSVATAGNEPAGGADIRLRKHPSAPVTVRLPNLVGSTATDADNLITANNPTATTVTVTGAGFTGGAAACALPT